METLSHCPICNSTDFDQFLTCTDYTVSHKEFSIDQCRSCGFRFTNPRPSANELGSYYKAEEYISHSDSKKGLVNRLYHLVRRYTLIKKLQLIVRLAGVKLSASKQKQLLDIGCGTGAFLDICKRAGFTCKGIEPDGDAREHSIKTYDLDVKDEPELDNLPKASFEIITLWHVLEHVPLLNDRILQIKQLMNQSGRVIVAVPNCSSFDAKHYNKYWAAYDLPRHLYHFTPKDIISIFEKNEMKVEQILPMRFDSFYVSMLSEKYKTGRTNYLKALIIGLISNVSAIKTGREFSSQIYVIKKN